MRVEMQAKGSAEGVVLAFTRFGNIARERGWTVRVENPNELAQPDSTGRGGEPNARALQRDPARHSR